LSCLYAKADALVDPIVTETVPPKVGGTVITQGNSDAGESQVISSHIDDDDLSIFEIVAGRAATCLVESDLRRDAKEGYSNVVSSSATNWINDATAFALQKAVDRVKLKVRYETTDTNCLWSFCFS
jgi:hypothetical protein